MLAVAVGADDVLAGEVLGYEGEASLQSMALAPVDRVADDVAAKPRGAVEDVLKVQAAAVVHNYQGEGGVRGVDGAGQPEEVGVRFVGGNQDDHCGP